MKRIFTFFVAMLIALCTVISVSAVEDTTEVITESITEVVTEVTTESVTVETTENITEKLVNISEYQYSIMLIILVVLIFGVCVMLMK